ncbi:MarR family winged helix-turn-helix transcriptional regulator [Peribacillus kribbensis]|uniref:MarR family winged helix-turn-helix transcriptional regulator n=1 Tax=Peribacillus kribbensis TaxID=356658 RepID=UPI0003FC17FB|nr:MarR family transcriptional regulator [Peribacillus kribbensis]
MDNLNEGHVNIMDELDSISETFFRYKNKQMEKKYDDIPLKMNVNKYQILKSIYMNKECIVADLVKKLELTSGATTLILNKLEEENLIARSRSTADRRLVFLELTDEGRRVYDILSKKRAEFLLKILNPLSAGEKDEFIRLFKKIADGLDQ